MKLDPIDKLLAIYIKLEVGAVSQEYEGRRYLFGKCDCCGQWKMLECSHFYSRALKTTRYDEENVAPLCGGCHKYFGEHPKEHTKWFEKRLGSERFEQLSIRANMTIKQYPIDKDKIKHDLEEKIKVMGGL